MAAALVTAKALNLPDLTCGATELASSEHQLHFAADQIGELPVHCLCKEYARY